LAKKESSGSYILVTMPGYLVDFGFPYDVSAIRRGHLILGVKRGDTRLTGLLRNTPVEIASAFRCRWLSTRCRQGWEDGSRRAFRHAGAQLDDPRWAVLDLIEPAAWTVSKTEAIDPASEFLWLDDDPTEHDLDWLRVHNRADRLIQVRSDYDDRALLVARWTLQRASRRLTVGSPSPPRKALCELPHPAD
jgi:hypothetical protein